MSPRAPFRRVYGRPPDFGGMERTAFVGYCIASTRCVLVRASSTLGSPPGENAMAGLGVRTVHPALVHGGVARLQAAAVGAGWARSGWRRPSSRLRRRLSRTAGPPVAQPPPPSSRTASCYCRWPPTCGI